MCQVGRRGCIEEDDEEENADTENREGKSANVYHCGR